jgi:hypothetical protein
MMNTKHGMSKKRVSYPTSQEARQQQIATSAAAMTGWCTHWLVQYAQRNIMIENNKSERHGCCSCSIYFETVIRSA